MKINKQKMIVLCMVLLCFAVTGCGKKKVIDEESSQVIQISLPPANVTPTPDPEQISADAVVTNGNLTMVNGYLTGQETADITDTSGESVDGDSSADMNTDNADVNTDNDTNDSTQDSNTSDDETGY